MLGRRNTVNLSQGEWPLCRYYYTHNNGSCDDILLFPKEIAKRRETRKRLSPICKKRRHTYPVVFFDQKILQPRSGKITRRWSTIRTTNKRQTLADILSSMARADNILKSGSNKILNEKWELMRSYRGLDSEKTEQPATDSNNGQSSHPTVDQPVLIIEMPTGTTATLLDSSIHISSSLVANPPTSLAGQETGHSSIDMGSPEPITPLPTPPSPPKESLVDVFLFLFGFVIFPLWWVGAWFYVIQKQDGVTKRREVFQLLNCCMSLVSLLLIGLMIGLTVGMNT
ncbi:uncharacterized protein EV154DRAFT_262263 [Mucor mucedo]|uniref:uncharacterized protein n=1 Tax=Mucor mucedo TaxID=29922 RepID=UPI00221FF708|nr:uncharacterized protein EV154DRAFT_262263 [Mucor mucedo]KAI7890074.1 hypothetical protein EV154DRAFT_262263 [Mucor mucedo]